MNKFLKKVRYNKNKNFIEQATKKIIIIPAIPILSKFKKSSPSLSVKVSINTESPVKVAAKGIKRDIEKNSKKDAKKDKNISIKYIILNFFGNIE